MVPLVAVDRASVPGGELVLFRRGSEFAIRVRGIELMNSRNHGSEDELGTRTGQLVAGLPAPQVLIGGLGFGYTLRAALDVLPSRARVDVVEIVPEVVRWNRTILADLARRPLEDPRVTVIEADVARVIARTQAGYDAIVLDVDNGPDGVYENNDGLYGRSGLAFARAALVPNGILAVWSSFQSRTFTTWLREVGFQVEVITIRSKHRGGPRHFIWLARRE